MSNSFEEWIRIERERLEQQMTEGLHHLTESYLVQGAYQQVIGQTTRLLKIDHLREEAHGQLMIALSETGQRSAALEQYKTCQRLLKTEMGIEPSQKLTRLYEEIQSAKRPVGPVIEPPSNNISLANQIQPGDFISQRASINASSHNLPAQTTEFVGREHELSELAGLFTETRLITILGPGGMGKTRLALEAARAALPHFAHGVFFVSLAPVTSAEGIVPAVAGALKFSFQGATDPKQQIMNFLRTKSILLVLDNFEHLLPAASLVSEILETAPQVKVVVTSQLKLNLQGETRFRIEGMDFPDWETTDDALSYSAVKLFMHAAKRVQPGFALSRDELSHLARICRQLQGMPLGILLAAAWIDTLSLSDISAEIARSLSFLETEQHNVPTRQRSMYAVFNYSWMLLSDEERLTFSKLSVFRGDFTREGAQSVAGATLHILAALVNKSMLRRNPDSGRYAIHEVLRAYAGEKLAQAGLNDMTRNAHCAYYANFMDRQCETLKTAQQRSALDEIEQEVDNVRAAWQYMVEHYDVDAIGKTMFSLWYFFSLRSQYKEAVKLFTVAVNALQAALASRETQVVLSHLRAYQGRFMIAMGDDEQGEAAIEASLESLPASASPDERLIPVEARLQSALRSGQYTKAWDIAQESLACAQAIGDQWSEAWLLYWQGFVMLCMDDPAEAQKIAQESLKIAAKCGDLWLNACLSTFLLGRIHQKLKDYVQAKEWFKLGLSYFQKIGQPWGISVSYWSLGNIAYGLQEYKESEFNYQHSLRISLTSGQVHLTTAMFYDFEKLRMAQGQKEIALQTANYILKNSINARALYEQTVTLRDELKATMSSDTYRAIDRKSLTQEQVLEALTPRSL
jgi:predicted ATPase